jgi:hypothetical protein
VSERRLEVLIDLVDNPLGLEMRIVMHTRSNLQRFVSGAHIPCPVLRDVHRIIDE